MLGSRRRAGRSGGALAVVLAGAALALAPGIAQAAQLVRVSTDPYTNASSQHKTEVEPDTFAFGSTIVAAFQVGRFTDGGASNIGWATSTDSGATWSHGFLPGITVLKGGTYDRVSDPSVAYDARHDVWIISSLAVDQGPSFTSGVAVLASRSTDGGLTWRAPRIVASAPSGDLDKNWTTCDDTPASPYYGHCYTQWDDFGNGGTIKMSTSTDGGRTWGGPLNTADNATGIGGQPVVRPDGVVVVPMNNSSQTAIRSFRSIDGGASWRATVSVASVNAHDVAGGVRVSPLPSAEVDADGRVYVAWQDCRFRASCSANDIVMSTSSDGVTWSAVSRVPIDGVSSGRDHFVPGLGVDRQTAGATARLGLTYYYYPSANCTQATCELDVGYVSSGDGGASWSAPVRLAGPMSIGLLAATTQGRMFGDYISTSVLNGTAWPVFAVARPPAGSAFNEAMYAPAAGLPTTGAP